jgi:hypothetical protein
MNSTNMVPHSDVGGLDINDHQTRVLLLVYFSALGLFSRWLPVLSLRSTQHLRPEECPNKGRSASEGYITTLDFNRYRNVGPTVLSTCKLSISPPISSALGLDLCERLYNPKTVFNLQDSDLSICAKVTDADPSWRIIWSNAKFVAVQNVAVGNGTNTFTLTHASSLGDWRVILFEPFGGTVQAVTSFTVIDEQNPLADLSVSKTAISSNASSGAQILYAIQITIAGPTMPPRSS